jgi:hypothetical protein
MHLQTALTVCIFAAGPIPAAATDCFKYLPAIVTVSGVISTETNFGPPGFGEDPSHDSKEKQLFVVLDSPLCVNGDKDPKSPNAESEIDVAKMEMVYFPENPFQKMWLGKHVSVTGKLFHAFDAHHHTPVLIIANETSVLPSGPSN